MRKGRVIWRVLLGIAVVVVFLATVWPTPYQRSTWAGMESRVGRFSGEQTVRVPWTLVAASDATKAQAFCAACHGGRQMDLKDSHAHKLWVAVGAEPAKGREGEALTPLVGKALPPHGALSVSVARAEEGKARVVRAEVTP